MASKGNRSRPLFNCSIVHLEDAVSANPDSVETLQIVLAELEHWFTDRSGRLKQKVRKALKRCLTIAVTSGGSRARKPGNEMPTSTLTAPTRNFMLAS